MDVYETMHHKYTFEISVFMMHCIKYNLNIYAKLYCGAKIKFYLADYICQIAFEQPQLVFE